ncbi:MAG: hypothetical protein AAGF04_05055 [Chlamydiota bacterium]
MASLIEWEELGTANYFDQKIRAPGKPVRLSYRIDDTPTDDIV